MSAEHGDGLQTATGASNNRDAVRRRDLLAKLGKGSAALASLAPLASRARGTHKLFNDSLPGDYGYCSVSGYQSAAVSGAPVAQCSAFAPSHFLTTPTSLSYSIICSGSVSAKKIERYLNTTYQTAFTETEVTGTLLATPLKSLVAPPEKNLVIHAKSLAEGVALRGASLPSGVTPTGQFRSIFTLSADDRTLLEVLYDGVASNNPASGNCYFLSAFLTVFNAQPSHLPLTKEYITGQYSYPGAADSTTDAYAFFRALCTDP
jgi:hypothetical protein